MGDTLHVSVIPQNKETDQVYFPRDRRGDVKDIKNWGGKYQKRSLLAYIC